MKNSFLFYETLHLLSFVPSALIFILEVNSKILYFDIDNFIS